MRRWIVRTVAAFALLAVVALAVTYAGLRASLPVVDGEIVADGLSAAATIERDAAGIPVITAATRADLAFATGFAHGQDRYFQMDLIRRQAAGELSALFGPAAIDTDKRYRFHRFRALAREVLAAATPAERSLLQRYADGVNAGLASLGTRPFEYWVVGAEPAPWIPEDTIVVVYAMFMQLNDSRAEKDVQRGYAKRVLPDDVYAWLYPQGTPWDAPLMGEPRELAPHPGEGVYAVRYRQGEAPASRERGRPPFIGSNNWAVSGALTATGRAMVSNDMHLGLGVPNIYYQARLVQTGDDRRDVAGVTLPGAPFVIAGSNGRVAWGYTNSYGDWSDAIVLVPGAAQDTYRTPAGDRPFEVHREVIEVKNEQPVEYEIRETIWGPVDASARYPDGEIAVSWTAHDPRTVNLVILELETASNVEEALGIANRMGIPPQNFVTGDADGNIGWTIAGSIPVRGSADAQVPADWSNGGGWSGWREPGEYPRIVNPQSGRLWTANARVADGDALAIIGDGGYDLAARARQIRDGLFARDVFAPSDMLALQLDDRAVFLGRWRELLLDVLDEPTVRQAPEFAEYRQLVADWVPRAAPESVGYRLVRSFRLAVRNRVFHGLTGPVRDHYAEIYEEPVELRISNQFEGPLWQLVNDRPLHLLPADYESWDALLLAAVRENIEWFDLAHGTPLAERTWGEFNTARIRHPISRALPFLSGWLDMPGDELSGDANLPRAQSPDFGASERFSVSPGDEANGIMQMPTGQSGHPLSPFYRQGHDDWVAGRASPFLPGSAIHTLTLAPPDGTLGRRD